VRPRGWWIAFLAVVIGVGVVSRMLHTGLVLIDKYLGDALYAVMIYVLLSLAWTSPARSRALAAMAITEFSFRDLLAYAVGIAGVAGWDANSPRPSAPQDPSQG
jgi:hypothetical protein